MLRIPLGIEPLQVGRHPSNDLTLPDEEISRHHASILLRDGRYWLVDQSRNGTFLNGKRLREGPLSDRDEIVLGSWKIRFIDGVSEGERETVVKKEASVHLSWGMIGESAAMKKVFGMIEKAAPTTNTVLIMGETGTGKELVARAIHQRSARERGPFVAINCGAISPQLIESELFGHERGAFTGALQRHAGAFEQARGGTLFLDEIGELPLELQPKLLRVLEEKRFRRVGGNDEVTADVRIVAATHRDLHALVREGKFREDLFFRLYSVPITLPPLRERGDDILRLIDFFLKNNISSRKRFSQEALERLKDHPWKGNVRELKNVMTRTLLFAVDSLVGPKDILFLHTDGSESPDRSSLEGAQREAIVKALRQNGWNKTKTAQVLGIAKSTLFHKIKEYGIQENA